MGTFTLHWLQKNWQISFMSLGKLTQTGTTSSLHTQAYCPWSNALKIKKYICIDWSALKIAII